MPVVRAWAQASAAASPVSGCGMADSSGMGLCFLTIRVFGGLWF
jgi:hypothetical protein